jgi:flagellar hook-associated protein 1 FlgK
VIFSALNVAASSLKTQQKAIDVVSHNIANVNTPGYSRQKAELGTLSPEQLGAFDFGRGVGLGSISRSVDQVVNQALLKNGPQQNYWQELKAGLNSIENVFGSLQNTGLSAAMDDFFFAAQQMANAPEDAAQKFNMRTKSTALATQISSMSNQLQAVQQTANANIDQNLLSANNLLTTIGSLNVQIRQHEGTSQGLIGAANDLRDQRDQAVRDLSAFMPIQDVRTAAGGVLLQTVSGDLLVQDGEVRQLARGAVGANGNFQSIVIAGTNTAVSGLDKGGKIGGSIALRDDRVAGYIKDLDNIAVNLSFAINQANASGVGSSRVSQVQSGLGVVNSALSVSDAAQNNPFAAQIQNGSFTVHVFDAAGVPLTPASKATITITAGVSTMASIAADIGANVPGVTASVDVSGKLLMNAGANTVGFSDDSSNFLAAYQVNSLFQGTSAASLKVSDAVQADAGMISTGQIDLLTSGINVGDNRAALLMVDLQNKPASLDGATAVTLSARTSLLSTKYGNDVALASQQQSFFQAEASSLNQQRQAFSGVNVDEELVSMIKFQRAYEASAKVIQTTNQMLDSLMGLIR